VAVTDSTLDGHTARKKDFFVVDVDVHANETPAALAPYCEMPWRKTLEHISTLPQRYLDIPAFAPMASPWPMFPQSGGQRRMTVTSPAQMRQDLDDLGVDIGVIFPDHFLLHAAIKQVDYAVALARAYNRWLVEEWLGEDRGLVGVVLAPHHDPSAAAAEIRRYAGHRNVVGVYLPTSCVEPLYGNRRYDPVYEAAQETGLPVMLHSVTALHPVFPFNLQGFESTFAAHILAHPFSLIANLVSMMETGVPVRYPDLKIAFTEGGIAWVPWIMWRMDKEYGERRREVPFLKDKPSTYVRRMFFATQPIEEPEHLRDMAGLLSLFDGENSVVFASDWPHHDFDHPSKVLQIPLSDHVRGKIMGGNALRLLGLEERAR
jgi:predicted TIM-barrel fold metal-dependent hydrolase